jgi:hypothetical protein
VIRELEMIKGIMMKGIGLNGLCNGNSEGVRVFCHEWKDSGLNPLMTNTRECELKVNGHHRSANEQSIEFVSDVVLLQFTGMRANLGSEELESRGIL